MQKATCPPGLSQSQQAVSLEERNPLNRRGDWRLSVCNIVKINQVTEGLGRDGTKYSLPEYLLTEEWERLAGTGRDHIILVSVS